MSILGRLIPGYYEQLNCISHEGLSDYKETVKTAKKTLARYDKNIKRYGFEKAFEIWETQKEKERKGVVQ